MAERFSDTKSQETLRTTRLTLTEAIAGIPLDKEGSDPKYADAITLDPAAVSSVNELLHGINLLPRGILLDTILASGRNDLIDKGRWNTFREAELYLWVDFSELGLIPEEALVPGRGASISINIVHNIYDDGREGAFLIPHRPNFVLPIKHGSRPYHLPLNVKMAIELVTDRVHASFESASLEEFIHPFQAVTQQILEGKAVHQFPAGKVY